MSILTRESVIGAILLVLVGVAGLTAYKIASETFFNRHPDEVYHVDAYCYFQYHLRQPDLNTDGLLYSVSGWSRVYNSELVYAASGSLHRLLHASENEDKPTQIHEVGRPLVSTPTVFLPLVSGHKLVPVINPPCQVYDYVWYRYLNVALYVFTLAIVFVAGRRDFWTIALGISLIAIPQVVYVYSYANSDAWALSFSLFLLLYAIHLARRPQFTIVGAIGLGVLTGLVFLTKKPFWLSIPFAYLFLGQELFRRARTTNKQSLRRAILLLTVLVFVTIIVAGPMLVIYPWTQGDFSAIETTMRELRALEDWKPSNPTAKGYMLQARGEPFRIVWAYPGWWILSAKSLYAFFGYLIVPVPGWMYLVALAGVCIGLVFTFDSLIEYWHQIPSWVKIALATAPVLIGLNVLASLYHSWTIDHQAQGRYLFPSLLPLAFLWAGLYEYESIWMRRVRLILLAVLVALGLYALWSVALRSPELLT